MGFEIVYWYHERLPNGKWNMEDRHEMKKKVGNPLDEVALDKIASTILAQLAKRDKLVVDVEVYEYTKKKINYKEATDGSGIVLKNKKYNTSTLSEDLVEEEIEADEQSSDLMPTRNLAPQPGRNLAQLPRNEDARRASNVGRVRTWMTFDPELVLLHEAKQKGLHYTVGQKYPIYEIEDHPTGVGQILTIVDDKGTRQMVSDKYFVANNGIRLIGDNEVSGGFSPSAARKDEPRLSYEGNVHNIEMPNLRPAMRSM